MSAVLGSCQVAEADERAGEVEEGEHLGQGVGTGAARPRWSPGALSDNAFGRRGAAVALLLDAGALDARADRADPHHGAVVEVLRAEREPLITSPVRRGEQTS